MEAMGMSATAAGGVVCARGGLATGSGRGMPRRGEGRVGWGRSAGARVKARGVRVGVLERERAGTSGGGVRGMSDQMREMRKELEEDERASALMSGFRGTAALEMDADTNYNAGVKMLLVETRKGTKEGDELPLTYRPSQIEAYFDRRPDAVVKRIAQLMTVGGGFIAGLVLDVAMGTIKKNDIKRAVQLREIITSLGPTYIKLGQALSIRPDILSPGAMRELQKLCDKVPSFDNATAFRFIEEELGSRPDDVFDFESPDPVAAASLGQVYKARIRATGDLVAVKVQRPFVLETVSLDLYIVRKVGMALKRFPQINTDVVALLDEFAARFFEELDYNKEASNTLRFAENMKRLPVVVPLPFEKYTSRRVIVTQWLEGEKLSQSQEDDVSELVSVGVIAYLTQLLESGFFHADPHPGNMIRTPEGKLAILDFGLMSEITEDQKYGMIEAISHLIHRDYARIGQDFVNLDFIPEGTDLEPILPVLGKVFDQALAGGGAKGINFQALSADLAEITFAFPFRIPPYFALVIRAIAVLEGIALVGDPQFAIIDEAWPWVARRMLTDDSPRLRAALRYMVYGPNDDVFDVERVLDLLVAMESFMDTNRKAGGEEIISLNQDGRRQGSPAARDALRFVFSKEGANFRDFVIDEVVKSVDAVSREGAVQIAKRLGLEGANVPLFLPGVGRANLALSPRLTDEDRIVLRNVDVILRFVSQTTKGDASGLGQQSGLTPAQQAVAQEFVSLLPEIAPVLQDFGFQLASKLANRVTARAIRDVAEQFGFAPTAMAGRAAA